MAPLSQNIGNYRLLDEIASGAFGRVYRAQHLYLTNRIVAVKLMHGHLSSQKERDSFLHEANLLEMLKHPYILPVLDLGLHDGFPYMVTEFASGGSLRQRLQQRSPNILPLQDILAILNQIAQALDFAHQNNVIHRDLKPENILFNAKGEALLADFGISTVLSTMSVQQATIVGTPPYMAPEQFKGTVCKESDQYALGCIAYELVTGQKPFSAPDFFSMGFKHMTEQPINPTQLNRGLEAHMSQAIIRAMSKERTDRYASVVEFVETWRKTKEQWITEGTTLYELKRYDEALNAFDEAIRLNPAYATTYRNKGITLYHLKRYDEALNAYDEAIRLNPAYATAYCNKGNTLHGLKRYDESLNAFDEAIRLNPAYATAYCNKGYILYELKRYDESLKAYDEAIRLDPKYALAYNNKGITLEKLGRHTEAQQAYAKARELEAQAKK